MVSVLCNKQKTQSRFLIHCALPPWNGPSPLNFCSTSASLQQVNVHLSVVQPCALSTHIGDLLQTVLAHHPDEELLCRHIWDKVPNLTFTNIRLSVCKDLKLEAGMTECLDAMLMPRQSSCPFETRELNIKAVRNMGLASVP